MTYDNTTLTKLVSRPVRKYYIHKKMSPLRLSANKFRPIVSPYGFQAGRDLYRATPSVTHDIVNFLQSSHPLRQWRGAESLF